MEEFLNKMMALEQDPETAEKEVFTLGFLDRFTFDDFINTLDQHTDDEVYMFLRANMEYIANRILAGEWENLNVLISDKFLDNYRKVLETTQIVQAVRIVTNYICYDFLTLRTNMEKTKRKLLSMSKLVNHREIQSLRGLGLTESVACNLALGRFSSIKEEVNIRRLNFIICHKDVMVMTEQMIVWIYEKLFDRVGLLFCETMFEYYSPEQSVDLGGDFMEIYSTISLAILDIVNNMTTPEINLILRQYLDKWVYLGRPPTRFSLISLSNDYARINAVVEELTRKGEYVP